MKNRLTRSEGFEDLVAAVHRHFAIDCKTTHEICEATTTPFAKSERWITPFNGRNCVQVLTCDYDHSGVLRQLTVSSEDGAWCELVAENNPDAPSGKPAYWADADLARAIESKLRHCFRWQRMRRPNRGRFASRRELAIAA